MPDIAEEHSTIIIRVKPDLKDERHHSLLQKVSNHSPQSVTKSQQLLTTVCYKKSATTHHSLLQKVSNDSLQSVTRSQQLLTTVCYKKSATTHHSLLQNVSNYSLNNTASHAAWLESSAMLW